MCVCACVCVLQEGGGESQKDKIYVFKTRISLFKVIQDESVTNM